MNVRLALLPGMILSAFLAACGGGGSEGEEPAGEPVSQVPSCTPVATPVRVQLFGDSTFYGYDSFTLTQAIPSPAVALQTELNARLGVGVAVVTLNAVNGATSTDLLEGTQPGGKPWPQPVDAEITIFNYAINDWTAETNLDKYADRLKRLADNPSKIKIFQTQVSVPQDSYIVPRLFAQRMRDTAKTVGVRVIDAEAYLLTVPNVQSYYADSAHPNAALYGMIARNAQAAVVAKAVNDLRCK